MSKRLSVVCGSVGNTEEGASERVIHGEEKRGAIGGFLTNEPDPRKRQTKPLSTHSLFLTLHLTLIDNNHSLAGLDKVSQDGHVYHVVVVKDLFAGLSDGD